MTADDYIRPRQFTPQQIADIFDVPLWLIDPNAKRPRFARLRWFLRRRRKAKRMAGVIDRIESFPRSLSADELRRLHEGDQ